LSEPNSDQIQVSVPLSRPYSGLYSACFHSSAAATGTIRNGVIIMVRTTPRPRNLRSSSSAMPMPSRRLTRTTTTVRTMVTQMAWRMLTSVSTLT
jgi:hypothetical protein